MVGRAKFESVQGKVFSSHKAFADILFRIEEHQHLFPDKSSFLEVKAFFHYEKAVLETKIKNFSDAYASCVTSHELTKNDNFLLATTLLQRRLEVVYLSKNLDRFIQALEKVEIASLTPLACMGWRMAGIYARQRGLNSDSKSYTSKALKMAEENNLALLHKQVIISQAVSARTWGEHDRARQLLEQVEIEGPDDVHQAIVNEILAVMEEKDGNREQAISLVKDALKITTQLDHVTMVPDETLYLGEQFEKHYKDLDQAEHYYQIGYEHAIRYAEHGISLTVERKQVVDAYLNILKTKKRSTGSTTTSPNRFSFAEGKSWKQIKDIFQHQLILYHSGDSLNSKKMAKKMNMPATTLYSLQSRLVERGYLLPKSGVKPEDKIDAIQDYIDNKQELSWTEINAIFEREIMHYLYEKYGYNKQRMAAILKLSYPALINKTRQLTQLNENILPN